MIENDIYFMNQALACAKQAYEQGEVPVGAVITAGGRIICGAFNQRETKKNALLHAESAAIYKACEIMGGWRLHMCDLYVTMEPCAMCAGAIINARINRVIFGVPDEKSGAFGSVIDLNQYAFNHKPQITKGVCEEECRALLQQFFKELRARKRSERCD